VEQEYVPTSTQYYQPSAEGYEETIGKRMAHWASRMPKREPVETGTGLPKGVD